MGKFGWDYPPGCSSTPFDQPDPPCEVCGRLVDANEHACFCPECPVCGTPGDPLCYEQHGMVRTQEQIISLADEQYWWERFAREEAEGEAAWLAELERLKKE